VARKKLCIPVLLVSATPSLETWFHAEEARYQKLILSNRAAKDSEPPIIELVDMKQDKKQLRKTIMGLVHIY